jgi:hypothetical protein
MTLQDAEQVIARELESGERLLWSGVPAQGFLLRRSDALMIPFSLMWGGFAIFWEMTALRHKAPFFFKLWGVPFVLVGLYMIFGRFFVDARQRSRMAYGVTDRRVVLISGVFSRNVKSLALKTITDLTLDEKSDGTGTITFGPTYPVVGWQASGRWGTAAYQSPCFDSIPRAKEVYATLRQAQGSN